MIEIEDVKQEMLGKNPDQCKQPWNDTFAKIVEGQALSQYEKDNIEKHKLMWHITDIFEAVYAMAETCSRENTTRVLAAIVDRLDTGSYWDQKEEEQERNRLRATGPNLRIVSSGPNNDSSG